MRRIFHPLLVTHEEVEIMLNASVMSPWDIIMTYETKVARWMYSEYRCIYEALWGPIGIYHHIPSL
jgi:hypothetical protein